MKQISLLLPLTLFTQLARAQPIALQPNADLNSTAAPDIANRAFAVTALVEAPGTEGVLAAQGGQLHGWALFIQNDRLHFVMNRENQQAHLETADAAFKPTKEIKVTVGPMAWVRLFADGKEVARKPFPRLLPAQAIDAGSPSNY